MRIAILGATSQIASDLILSFAADDSRALHLFARRPSKVADWLASSGLSGRYPVDEFSAFARQDFDAVINFVGVGNPAQAAAMGRGIFDVTLHFDGVVLDYLKEHPACRYLFLSSGAAYGSRFSEPVSLDTPAMFAINKLTPCEWYGTAKFHAECRHRAFVDLPIVDIRVFNYFSRSQDLSARFLMSDILRAIRDRTVLQTSSDYIVRDFLHPSDFHQLVRVILDAPAENAVVDCYSRAPVDKPDLLVAMQQAFGLQYKTSDSGGVNATGNKPHYYSLNRRAADFGYQPAFTSLEGVLEESKIILDQKHTTTDLS